MVAIRVIESQKYIFIKALAQPEGDLHLSASTWNASKALITSIRVVTTSQNWDLYLLQNDNGHAANDANIPELKIVSGGHEGMNITLHQPYEDEDDSKEVHLYFIDHIGAVTADIYIFGEALR